MHHPVRHTLARTAVLGGILSLALGAAPKAQASPPHDTSVPCVTSALVDAMSSAVSGETLLLARHCTYELEGPLPDVTTDMAIVGRGATLKGSATSSGFTILTVHAGVRMDISDLNFVNGGGRMWGGGGAIYNGGGSITIQGGIFRGNNVNPRCIICYTSGGAIYNDGGALTVRGATFVGNSSSYGHGGGAIFNDGTASITNSTFTGNTSGDGGAISNGGRLTVGSTDFTGNQSSVGGAIDNYGQAALYFDRLSGNNAYDGGAILNVGTLTADFTSIISNTALEHGGGIYNTYNAYNTIGTVHLHRDRIQSNRPDNCYNVPGCQG